MYKLFPCIRGDEGVFVESTHEVVEEVPVSITINGRHALTAMMSPHMIREFVIGFLFTERIIRSIDEIESIKIEENSASVLTNNPF